MRVLPVLLAILLAACVAPPAAQAASLDNLVTSSRSLAATNDRIATKLGAGVELNRPRAASSDFHPDEVIPNPTEHFTYDLGLPEGYSLHFAPRDEGGPSAIVWNKDAEIVGEILEISAYSTRSLDLIPATLSLDESGVLHVDYSEPISGSAYIQYFDVTRPGVVKNGSGNPLYVSVPADYVYDPQWPVVNDRARHDYCTHAPDEFWAAINIVADFRGPCARHDMCYDAEGATVACNMDLYRDMLLNCTASLWDDPGNLGVCYSVATAYFAMVTIAHAH
ncbi:MAG: hypothetical protein Q3962_06010 [Corynebacterium sp.]|nr:hypothetical protein [Corynebacterium sp.]